MIGYDKTFSGAFDCFLELDKVIWVLKTYCDMSVNAELEVPHLANFCVAGCPWISSTMSPLPTGMMCNFT